MPALTGPISWRSTAAASTLSWSISFSNDYIQAMEAQQRINLDIVQRFAEEGIEFASDPDPSPAQRLGRWGLTALAMVGAWACCPVLCF